MGPSWCQYRKKVSTRATRIETPDHLLRAQEEMGPPLRLALARDGGWAVATREGPMTAPWGAWLALDSNGDPYPIAADVFAATYEKVC